MPTLRQGDRPYFLNLEAGKVLTVAADVASTMVVRTYPTTQGLPSDGQTVVGAGTSQSWGPFLVPTRYAVEVNVGSGMYATGDPSRDQVSTGAASSSGVPASLRFCIPGRNPSTTFSDVSGLGADLVPEAANSGAFATTDYFSSIAGTDSGLTITQAKTAWTPATQSMVLAFVVKKVAPGANQNLLSWGGHVSGANIGFYVSHRTSGSLKIVPVSAGATLNAQPDSTLNFSEATAITLTGTWSGTAATNTLTYSTTLPPEVVVGCAVTGDANIPAGVTITAVNRATNVVTISSNITPSNISAATLTVRPAVDHHCLIAYDAPSGSWYMYRDGVLSNAWTNTMVGASAYAAAQTITGVRWGGTSGTGATVVAASGYGLQGYLWDGALPARVGIGAQTLAANMAATARAPLSGLVA